MNAGLIGSWSPTIGDPSFGGWLTVMFYAIAAWAVWHLLRDSSEPNTRLGQNEEWFWRVLFVAMVTLGINKQLDLQSAFTEIGRIVADRQGWYAERRQVQLAFIAGAAIMGTTLFSLALYLTWGTPATTRWALVGSSGLVVFVIIRAASFHHVDVMLSQRLSGLKINWLMEMGAQLVIIASAWRRRRD